MAVGFSAQSEGPVETGGDPARREDPVGESVGDGVLGAEPMVAVGVLLDLFDRLTRMAGEDFDHLLALADDLLLWVANRPTTATQLAPEMPISRQAMSKHLSALDQAGLVERTVSGREVHYSLRSGPLSDVVGWVNEVGSAWDQRLATLKSRLNQ